MLQRTATIEGPSGASAIPKRTLAIGALATMLVAFGLWMQAAPPAQNAEEAYGKLPLSFVPNQGQTDKRVRFTAQGAGFAFHFTQRKVVLSLDKGKRGVALHMAPLGANPDARLEAGAPTPGKVSYFVGNDRQTNLPTYGELTYRDLWPGIDMVFRGREGKLKYEFHVRPGADPSRIRLAYRGAEGLSLGSAGNLLIGTPLGTLRDSRPWSYQMIDGKRVGVGSAFALSGANAYGFALGSSYDAGRPLVIDPGLSYSTYLGGGGNDTVDVTLGIAVDSSGSAYVNGYTTSPDFPTTPGAYDSTSSHFAFVTKLNPTGTALVYSTYLGPANPGAIAVDASGNAYLTGVSHDNFPTTQYAYDNISVAGDAYVTKLNTDGTGLVYSTLLGENGFEHGYAIAVDDTGQAWVAGNTDGTDFPVTADALDPTYNGNTDTFMSKFSADGTGLLYSTLVGGSDVDTAKGVDVDPDGAAYLVGFTNSSDIPTTAGVLGPSYNGGNSDAFVVKLSPTETFPYSTTLSYLTYLGGESTEYPAGIAVDADGHAYVGGMTGGGGFPTTPGAFDTTASDDQDLFVSKLNAGASALAYSTYVGGEIGDPGDEYGGAIAVDQAGSAYLTGSSRAQDYPVSDGAFDTTASGGFDTVVTRLNAAGTAIVHSTFLGEGGAGNAIAVDSTAHAYVTGVAAETPPFPTTAGAYDTTYNGGIQDAFVSKLDMSPSPQGSITVVKDATPDDPQDFDFTLSGGLSPVNFSLDDDSDGTLSNTHTVDVAAHSGFSIAETVPSGWDQTSATCSDGSPVSDIDVSEGETVTCTFANRRRGSIVAVKQSTPQDPQDFDFNAGGGLTPASFQLDDDADGTLPNTLSFDDVTPGSGYSLAETVPAGWQQMSATCSDGSPVSNIDVAAGETVTCTFANSKLGEIVVTKDATPDDPQDFSFTAGGGLSPGSFSLDDDADGTLSNTHTFTGVAPGSGYSLAETVPAGWQQTSATCSDGSPVSNIDVAPGETITCDFSNRKLGQITVIKDAIPNNAQDFSFTAGGGLSPTSFQLDDDANATLSNSRTFANLPQGSSYSLSETVPTGWIQQSATCSDGSPVSAVDLGPGESVICTFVNSTGYPRPISATPTYFPLVIAFDPCNGPTRVHAPPPPSLDGSCIPAQSSPRLTAGIPDASAGAANFGGSVRLKAILGAAGPPDDSDMQIIASVEDVRCKAGATPCGSPNNSGGADYIGELQGQFDYRRTDRESGPAGGPYSEAATMEDRTVSFPLTCLATGGTVGATCTGTASLTALYGAGAVRDNKRTIVEVEQMRVNDGGADGQAATTPNTVFARQGVFAP